VAKHVLQGIAQSQGVGFNHYACKLDYLERTKREGLQEQSRTDECPPQDYQERCESWIAAGAKHLSVVLLGG
jgi:hypothetical protein